MPNAKRNGSDLRARLAELEDIFDLLPVCIAIARDRDCHDMVVQGRAVPLIDADGNPCGGLSVFVDVTEREMRMRQLQDTQRQIITPTDLLPICAHCKKIRDPDDSWIQIRG